LFSPQARGPAPLPMFTGTRLQSRNVGALETLGDANRPSDSSIKQRVPRGTSIADGAVAIQD